MREKITALLKTLAKEKIVDNCYFIGGSAIAYYLNHRISYDVDLISTQKLDVDRLLALSVKLGGRYISDPNESMFRIKKNTKRSSNSWKE